MAQVERHSALLADEGEEIVVSANRSRRSRRLGRLIVVPDRGGVLLALGAALLVLSCTLSNLVAYIANTGGLDGLVLAGSLAALLATALAPPKKVGDIGLPILLFVLFVISSLRHEWSGTPILDIAKATAVVLMSVTLFFAGASLRQRATVEWLKRIEWLGMGLYVVVVIGAFGLRNIQKNIVGGTMFELVMLVAIARYVRTGVMNWKVGVQVGGAIIVGALLTDHRVMMAIGAAVGGAIVVYASYRPGWFRALAPVAAVIVAIGAIIVLTELTRTSAMVAVDAQVKASTGRTAMSGRQTFWGPLVDAILHGPLNGYGPTKLARDVTGLEFSTHNAFLQVGLNFGLVGIGATILILILLSRRAALAPISSAGALLSAYLMGVIVHNSSENVLFQNNFPIAALTWLNIGFLAASCAMTPLAAGGEVRSIYRIGRR